MDGSTNHNSLFADFLVTVIIYTLPVYIYRYGIRNKPVEKKKARKITIIYGLSAFIVMSVLIFVISGRIAGGSIVFWSWVNYKILTGKEKLDSTDERDITDDSLEQTVPDFNNELLQDEGVQPADDKDFARNCRM